eukprot:CAMPEP_0206224634 /NCGR_PEP_ID=MMETSP0047_2-20121206/7131_1 /ASSEMBLY_ACC=CAM_ASM_000192 /TAXON_ID=195065 /ORGANISM="Chroomonas mesostigmatica_cf, Strain CCMP1168" /LENGTH=526 /DNA_ID=CAMNT_0053647605 /DNA_START=105 /DNA_END=1682 /DNA_ORIENTATION=+
MTAAARGLVCGLLLAAVGGASAIGAVAARAPPMAPGVSWPHRGLVDELGARARANLRRVEQLSSSIEELFGEVDRLKKFVGTKSGSVLELAPPASAEADDKREGTPDWVDALGGADGQEGGWIDGTPSCATPQNEAQGMYKYGQTQADDWGTKSHAVRVTEIRPQEQHLPFGLRRTESMQEIVIDEDEPVRKPVDELVAFLDLDKCSIYGQDGNDLTIAVQWMQGGMDKLCGLYSKLVNPQLKPLYQQLKMSVEKIPVVLYTMRPQLLRYKSAVRGRTVAMQWKKEWHHSADQIVIPAHVENPEEVLDTYSGTSPLHPQEQTDLYMSFQRLIAIRQALKEELSLDANPPMVVTAVMKDVQGTATKLGLPPECSYLWDDNEVIKGQPHVLTVDPYVAMDRERRENVLEYMNEIIPAHSLSQDVVEFMLGAKPDSCSMKVTGTEREYVVQECSSMPRFPIPDLPLRYSTPHFMAMSAEEEVAHSQQKQRKHRGKYSGSLVEYYTAAWRKGDEALAAQKEWEQRADVVW